MKKIKQMIQGATHALLRKEKPKGPLYLALDGLANVVSQAKVNGLYVTSATIQSIEVLLDHTGHCRKALAIATKMVDVFEEDGAWTPERTKKMVDLVAAFKLACVGVRLHQQLPEEKTH